MINSHGREKLLDEKLCFEKYIELGSVAKVRDWLYTHNHLNIRGTMFARQSVYRAAWFYAAEFPRESFEFLMKSHIPYSIGLEYETWVTSAAYHSFVQCSVVSQWVRLVKLHPDYPERVKRYQAEHPKK